MKTLDELITEASPEALDALATAIRDLPATAWELQIKCERRQRARDELN